jgi:hypothetical protein
MRLPWYIDQFIEAQHNRVAFALSPDFLKSEPAKWLRPSRIFPQKHICRTVLTSQPGYIGVVPQVICWQSFDVPDFHINIVTPPNEFRLFSRTTA